MDNKFFIKFFDEETQLFSLSFSNKSDYMSAYEYLKKYEKK